jgi:hypothetical protein
MPRAINKLSAILVSRRTLKPGHYGDGGGLYLQVSESGSKLRGLDKVALAFAFTAAAYNLVRLPRLLAGASP